MHLNIRTRGLTMLLLLLVVTPAFAGVILWDISHGPLEGYHLEGNYSDFARRFGMIGYELHQGEEPIGIASLWDIDILVISALSNQNEAYSVEEVERIASFVAGGGGVVILADNSESHPENLDIILEQFDFISAIDDEIGDLVSFADHPLFEDVERIVFVDGSAVNVTEEGTAENIAFDEEDRSGVALNESMSGKVVLIGDADLWVNDFIDWQNNNRFALNVFFMLDRERRGSLGYSNNDVEIYLPQNATYIHNSTIYNNGEDLLEIGTEFPEEVQEWISCTPKYAVIEPEGSCDLHILFNSADLDVDNIYSATLSIWNNSQGVVPFEIDYSVHVRSSMPVHFEVPAPSGYNHSILVREIVIEGDEAPPGIEIGVFTPENMCGGGSVSAGGMIGIAAIADDPMTDVTDGFINGETFTFKVYLPWSDRELEAAVEFEHGPQRFQSGGFTVVNLNARPSAALTWNLNERWNLISLNVHPASFRMEDIFSELIEQNLIIRIKDRDGRFWDLPNNFNNLRDWDLTRGYQVRIAQPCQHETSGVEVDPETPIRLDAGWDLIAYLPQNPLRLTDALASVIDNVEIVKADDGGFFLSEWDWNGIGEMEPGEGYWIRSRDPAILIYPEVEEEGAAIPSEIQAEFESSPSSLDMSLLLEGFPTYCQIKITSMADLQVGAGRTDANGRLGLPVWGDDPETETKEGLVEGGRFFIKYQSSDKWENAKIKWREGSNVYHHNALSVGTLKSITSTPHDPLQLAVSPNPFNDRLNIGFNIEHAQTVKIAMYDVRGRLITTREVNGVTSGWNNLTLNANNLPAGVLFLKFSTTENSKLLKVIHLP